MTYTADAVNGYSAKVSYEGEKTTEAPLNDYQLPDVINETHPAISDNFHQTASNYPFSKSTSLTESSDDSPARLPTFRNRLRRVYSTPTIKSKNWSRNSQAETLSADTLYKPHSRYA